MCLLNSWPLSKQDVVNQSDEDRHQALLPIGPLYSVVLLTNHKFEKSDYNSYIIKFHIVFTEAQDFKIWRFWPYAGFPLCTLDTSGRRQHNPGMWRDVDKGERRCCFLSCSRRGKKSLREGARSPRATCPLVLRCPRLMRPNCIQTRSEELSLFLFSANC